LTTYECACPYCGKALTVNIEERYADFFCKDCNRMVRPYQMLEVKS